MKSKLLILLFALIQTGLSGQTIVSSLSELLPYLDDDGVDIKMTPGTYNIGPADKQSGLFPNEILFLFEGSNSTFDFTDVTFKIDTLMLQQYGNIFVTELSVRGTNLVLKNLTMIDIGDNRPGRSAVGIEQ